MSINLWAAGAILVVFILLSALFSGSETAMTAASRARMHALERQGDPRAAIVNRLLAGRDRLIGAMLLGNTLFNIGASALLTAVLVAMVGESGAIYATAVDDRRAADLRGSPAQDGGDQLSRPRCR